MKKSKLKKENQYLRDTISVLRKEIDTLCGDDEYAKSVIKLERQINQDLADALWSVAFSHGRY